jgi:tetratricopeptide (TPR) repeat protein
MEQFERMKLVFAGVVLATATSVSAAAQPAADRQAQAYAQFLLGHHLEEAEDIDGAIAAYKRASELDPTSAHAVAELAGLYLRQNKIQEALTTAGQALKISATNPEANRVAGIVYAALAETGRDGRPRPRAGALADENIGKAIRHLEVAVEQAHGEAEPTVRAMLARLYVRNHAFDKAIPLLTAPRLTLAPGAPRMPSAGCRSATIRACCPCWPTSMNGSGAGRMRSRSTRVRWSSRRAASTSAS